ncbi:MAG: DNA polymerase III subunit gamma/tau, partial [Deltaproteobacteria bacterium]|nr:DNA polymerase III subunit gamma/tau [Deltaproteobacteria bacterium]
ARKWRPKTFEQLVGQEHVSQALINGLDQDRLHHAFMFTGTRGVGKTTIARILAKCLNCETGVSSKPCGECSSCVDLDDGRFVDMIEIDAASRTGVDDMRELLESVHYTPTRGRYKVYIIDEVHMLSTPSFNALLKTLEEPPPYSVIILITSNPDSLLPTIRSRCQMIRFNALSEELIFEELKKRDDLSAEEALVSSKLSNGSLGRALMLDSDILEWRKELIQYLMHLKPYSALRVLGLAESMPLSSNPEDMEKLNLAFEFISLWLRDLMLIKMDSDKKVLTNIDLIEQSAEIAQRWDIDNILNKMNYVQSTWSDIYHLNANKQLSFENLFIRIGS